MAGDRERAPAGRSPARSSRAAARSRSLADRIADISEGFGVSTGPRAVLLALVVCALALSVAVPLRNYVGQRQELATVQAEHDRLAALVADLSQRKQQLADPAEVAARARTRLGYVQPGETPYVVQLPGEKLVPAQPPPPPPAQWYGELWGELRGKNP